MLGYAIDDFVKQFRTLGGSSIDVKELRSQLFICHKLSFAGQAVLESAEAVVAVAGKALLCE